MDASFDNKDARFDNGDAKFNYGDARFDDADYVQSDVKASYMPTTSIQIKAGSVVQQLACPPRYPEIVGSNLGRSQSFIENYAVLELA